jgi:hypothetical protein
MSKTAKPAAKHSAEEAVTKALKANPEATVAEVAAAAGVGRSTASKALARLASAGQVRRTEGRRDGGRRVPDRFALAPVKPAGKAAKLPFTKDANRKATEERLKPGQLDGLVLAFLKENIDSGPHGPTAVAKALNRSSGAVGNCLVRLTRERQVREVSKRPRCYSLAA